ncbi:MAG: HAMP domain-containing protein [Deltaproteobacteria bacterium]|nr:HAMP domain-containing protein [Deltaproteobacteria bacterium]
MRLGIKLKFALLLSGILMLTTSVVGIIMIYHQKSSLEAQLRSMAGTITDEFAADGKMPLLQKDSLAMNLLAQNILKYPGITDAYVINHDLVIEGHTRTNEVGHRYKDAALIAKTTGPLPWLIKESAGELTFAAPIVFKKTTVGYAVISFSDGFIKKQVSKAIRSVVIIALLAIAGVAIMSLPLASRLLRPIFTIFKGTQEITLGNLDYRIPAGRRDEIGELINAFNAMASELKKKEILKGVFNRYVNPHVATEILKEPEKVRLGGERRIVTVFFADIRGFTALTKKTRPEDVVELLNRYFTLLTEVIFAFEGTVDKFIGDAVMSVFGSPVKMDFHLERGVKAAFAIKTAVEKINRVREKRGAVPLNIGIGLDSGVVIAGNMGSVMRMEYTAVGDAVNMASRLSDIAKGGQMLVSDALHEKIKDNAVAERLSEIEIKGVDHPVTLYNITELKGAWKDETARAADKAITEFNLLEIHGSLSKHGASDKHGSWDKDVERMVKKAVADLDE